MSAWAVGLLGAVLGFFVGALFIDWLNSPFVRENKDRFCFRCGEETQGRAHS